MSAALADGSALPPPVVSRLACPEFSGLIKVGSNEEAVLTERLLTDEVVERQRGAALDPLPASCAIVRSVPGDHTDAMALLVDAIASELTDRAPVIEA